MPTKEEFKTLLIAAAVLIAVFLPITLYVTNEINPVHDSTYAEIYGMEEE